MLLAEEGKIRYSFMSPTVGKFTMFTLFTNVDHKGGAQKLYLLWWGVLVVDVHCSGRASSISFPPGCNA